METAVSADVCDNANCSASAAIATVRSRDIPLDLVVAPIIVHGTALLSSVDLSYV